MGNGPFDDDQASDWVWELQEANDWSGRASSPWGFGALVRLAPLPLTKSVTGWSPAFRRHREGRLILVGGDPNDASVELGLGIL
jgi:hypothetical protein